MDFSFEVDSTPFFFSKTIKTLIQKSTSTLMTDSDLNVQIIPTVVLFLGEVLSELFILMNKSKRNFLTLQDFQDLISKRGFYGNRSSLILNFQESPLFQGHILKKLFCHYERTGKPVKSRTFLHQFWYFSSEKALTYLKNKDFLNSGAISKSIDKGLSREQKILVRYTFERLRKGTTREQQICLNFLLKSTDVNQIILFLIVFLKTILKKIHINPKKVRIILNFFQSLLSSLSFNQFSLLGLFLPFLFKLILGKINNEEKKEFWILKIYSSRLVTFYLTKVGFQQSYFFGKVVRIFIRIILFKKDSIALMYGPLFCLSLIGNCELELLIFPLFFSFELKSEKGGKKRKNLSLRKTRFQELKKFVLFSYFLQNYSNPNKTIFFKKRKILSRTFKFLENQTQ